MLASAARLRRRSEFAAVVRGGRRAGSGAVVVHLVTPVAAGEPTEPVIPPDRPAGTGPGDPADVRAGFVVPRTVGNAVTRNLVRRRLRHLVAERLPSLPPGSRLVVRALPAAARRDFGSLAGDLDSALASARARRGRRRTG